MTDLTRPFLIKLKGWLFLLIGLTASGLLVYQVPSLRVTVLLVLAVWGFCRFYCFAFYVIEHYVDPGFRFSGLVSFLRYAFSRRRPGSDGA